MNKNYYLSKYEKLYDACYNEAFNNYSNNIVEVTNELFECQADVEHIVGYYLYYYKNEAMDVWKENLSFAKERGYFETDTDKKVTNILTQLFLH